MLTIDIDAVTIALGRDAAFGRLNVEPTRFNADVQRYIYEYGLRQILNDACSDKKDENGNKLPVEHVRAKAEKRLAALYEGTLRTRSEGTPADPLEAEIQRLVFERIDVAYKGSGWIKSLPKGTKNRRLAAVNARQRANQKPEFADDGEMVAAFLANSPEAPGLRKRAERNVAEAAADAIDF